MSKQFYIILVVSITAWQSYFVNSGTQTVFQTAAREQYRRPKNVPYPSENPYSDAKYELGRTLFFDPIMSGSFDKSCSSCHNPKLSWGDGLPRAVGTAGRSLALRSPTLLNVAWQSQLGWDGKFKNLEAVAFGPITSTSNMNITQNELIARLKDAPHYVKKFAEAFEDRAVSRNNLEQALATYQRSIVSQQAAFDRWIEGDETAIGPEAKRGFTLFNTKAKCFECHVGWNFTDGSFHDIGSASGEDIGRGLYFPNSVKLRYAFKTPTLRDIFNRAPYMHDGSIPTLEKVINLYNDGGTVRPSRSKSISPLGLSEGEKRDLIAFLGTLSQQ